MRLSKILPIAVVGVFLIGVVVLIVVEVANYDDPTTGEVVREPRGEGPASLRRCPEERLGDFEKTHDPGTRGETVPPGPTSALVCSLTDERARFDLKERVIRDRGDLTGLTAALNTLPPAVPWPEGEYACPEEEDFYELIGLRYADVPEVQIAVAPGFCSGTTVLNLKESKEFGDTLRLRRVLDGLFEKGS
jgi:hypothetical protein